MVPGKLGWFITLCAKILDSDFYMKCLKESSLGKALTQHWS